MMGNVDLADYFLGDDGRKNERVVLLLFRPGECGLDMMALAWGL